jgi:hypothetical protein
VKLLVLYLGLFDDWKMQRLDLSDWDCSLPGNFPAPSPSELENGGVTQPAQTEWEIAIPTQQPDKLVKTMIKTSDLELNWEPGEAARQKGAVRNTCQDYGNRLLAEYGARLERRVLLAGESK